MTTLVLGVLCVTLADHQSVTLLPDHVHHHCRLILLSGIITLPLLLPYHRSEMEVLSFLSK